MRLSRVTRFADVGHSRGTARFARAIFRNEKESWLAGRLAGWLAGWLTGWITLAKSDWSCVGLPSFSRLAGNGASAYFHSPPYTRRYSLAGHSHRTGKCAARDARRAFLPAT